MAKLKLIIVVDQNDGDWNTRISGITEKQLEELLPVFAAIKAFEPYKGDDVTWQHLHSHNWPTGEYAPREDLGEKPPEKIYEGVLTEEQCEMFSEFCPYGEYGFHSIEEIKVLKVAEETDYL
jgi:hypothetical protein